ncbi:serine hydrolase [Candidatus Wolfebacteria bacterium]|nr:serine hydrolase [Candidatus Wolfebacteria bacterium]
MKNNKPVKTIRITKPMMIAGLVILILWGASLYGAWFLAKNNFWETKSPNNENSYKFLNPRLQYLTYSTTEERRAKTLITLFPLKKDFFEYLKEAKEKIAFYIEDLNTGAWIGWQERDEFIPASLLKVPLAMGVMKKIDSGQWSLGTTFEMNARYKDKSFGTLWQTENGAPLTVENLIKEMLQYSDNTAANIFFDKLTSEERDNIYYHIGIINPEAPFDQASNRPLFKKLSPKDLATIFRALYNATYLTRNSSNYLLEILTQTKFDKIIANDIPKDIPIAHKIANFFTKDPKQPKNFHDCGIVFLPEHPYLYCVMTKDFNAEEAKQFIVDMGNKTYEYFNKGGEIKN